MNSYNNPSFDFINVTPLFSFSKLNFIRILFHFLITSTTFSKFENFVVYVTIDFECNISLHRMVDTILPYESHFPLYHA